MIRGKWISGIVVCAACTAGIYGSLWAQAPEPRTGREQLTRPVYRVAQETNGLPAPPAAVGNLNSQPAPPQGEAAAAQEHPLEPALKMAYAAMTNIRNNIRDYSCTLVKRERINGKLNDQEFMFLKVRHEPFSVYMYFLGPERVRGQEVIYVAGRNNGNLLGHGVGIRKIAGTVPLLPTGAMAMQGQRYPITEIGMFNLTKRLVQVAEADKRFGECEVKFFKNAKINNRSVTCIQVVHPIPRKNFLFHLARVWVDDELNLPVRYESYDWPVQPGEKPPLLEEYTYTDIKLNNNFTDMDFNETNPKYNFR